MPVRAYSTAGSEVSHGPSAEAGRERRCCRLQGLGARGTELAAPALLPERGCRRHRELAAQRLRRTQAPGPGTMRAPVAVGPFANTVPQESESTASFPRAATT